jgi:signal peptidase II
MTNAKKVILLVFLVLLLDQALKIWVKTHFYIGQSIEITPWFHLLFVENNGMAFGMEFMGKLLLSIFRIVAIGFIGYYVYLLNKKQYRFGFILAIALILAGAIGNVIDGAFYGMVFNSSEGQIATFLNHPEGQQSYSSFLHGKVVDMLYFPLIKNARGETLFFSPVFNIADTAITVGAFLVLLFYRKELNESLDSPKKKEISAEDEK